MIGYTAASVATFSPELSKAEEHDGLAARVAAGDREAFVTVYRAHFAAMRAFAERLLGCPMAADDLVHDLFVGLPRSLRGFRGECPLRNYLIAIAIRLAHNHLRAAQRRRKLEERALSEAASSAARPDGDLEQRELARLLITALDRLPLDQRVAFVLCELEERTSAEAAEILGELSGTVRARVFYAKRKLREELDELARERGITVPEGSER
jgi:RNA polymerase sigma-70 factor (ECF subfamily)